MDEEKQILLLTFLDEAEDLLMEWEQSFLVLEESITQSKLDSLFGVTHNLKGSSRSVGLNFFGALVHKVEDVIELARQ